MFLVDALMGLLLLVLAFVVLLLAELGVQSALKRAEESALQLRKREERLDLKVLELETGFTLFEMLISLLISSLAVSLLVPSLRETLLLEKTLRGRIAMNAKQLHVESELRNALTKLPPSSLGEFPRIHSAGDTSFLLGKRLGPETALNVSGAAITFLEAMPERLLVVSNSGKKFCDNRTAIPRSELSLRDIKFWLGVSVDGVGLLSGELRRSVNESGCERSYSGTLVVDKARAEVLGLFSGESRVLAVIPLVDSFSLYLSKRGELRRISLFTAENQPVESGVEGFFIEERLVEEATVVFAPAVGSTANRKVEVKMFRAAGAMGDYLNWVLR